MARKKPIRAARTTASRKKTSLSPPPPNNDHGWPFGNNPRALEGFLGSLDDVRGKAIQDFGSGVRVYPQGSSARGAMIDAEKRACSNDTCRQIYGDCRHLWEDDFRFGRFKNMRFTPPAKWVRIRDSQGGKYSGVERKRDRPNPEIRGEKAATIARHARQWIPIEVKELGSALAHRMRCRDEEPEKKRGRGRPRTDIYDVALVGALRFLGGHSYEELSSLIQEWAEAKYITAPFHFNRLIEAMHKEDFTKLIDEMCLLIEGYFRKVATIFVTDGFVLSTARSDNPRNNRFTRGKSVQLMCHSQYDMRWGLLTGVRLTWYARGKGSGEPLQFPYLCDMTARRLHQELNLADGAFSSDRNFAYADERKFRLLSPINPTQFKPETKKFLTVERARFHLAECDSSRPGPLMTQVFPFRGRGEGWHNVVRQKSQQYLVSRPDRFRMPLTRAEDQKKYPDKPYVGLPVEQVERDAFIEREQCVGRSPINEIYARRLGLHLRALVKASLHYNRKINFFVDHPFEPIPQDEAWSVYLPVPGQAA